MSGRWGLRALLVSAVLAMTACSTGIFQSDIAAGASGETSVAPDGAQGDAGTPPATSPETAVAVVARTQGGGMATTSLHRLFVTIGGPQPNTIHETQAYRLQLGSAAALQ